ncbi:MAG: VirB4 family type IV secretion/conjugal transfer ATPase [Legionella sp.]|nr:VirB4 family type IV secretion/conjugal transfer ATPase [Legionella sp.]
MSLSKLLKQARAEVRLSELVPFTHLNSATVFECESGAPGSTIKVEGIAFITQDNSSLNQLNAQWHQALTSLDERFIQYVTVHRKKESLNLEGNFTSDFDRRVDEKYHARFKNKALFKNDIYLTTLLKGDNSSKAAKGINYLSRLSSYLSPKDLRSLNRNNNLSLLESKVSQLKSQLAPFNPRLLGKNDAQSGTSELMGFLSLFVNARTSIAFKNPVFNAPIAQSIADTHKEEVRYPRGHLGQYLSAHRIFFGEYIQFQGATPQDCRFGALLSIKNYGRETAHIVLDPLYELECEFIATHSFAPLARDAALKEIARKRSKLINAEDMGISQIEELSTLEDDIASEKALLGYHHNSLLLLADSIDELNTHILEATRAYAYAGIVMVRETFGIEPMFCAQMPGNHHYITRASLITSHNFTDFCSLHNYQTGFKNGNHLSNAVTLLETPSKTPVYFNFHTRGSSTNPAPGHTAVFGATNAGKNTLVAFLDSQMGRYNNRSFFLDRNEAAKIYVLSHKNSSYTVISPDTQNEIKINPFQLADTQENRTFLKSFMAELVKRPGEDDLPSDLAELLNECVNYAFDSLDIRFRQLTHIVKNLPLQFSRWPELRRFLQAQGLREAGEFAWLFDNEFDSLNLNFDKVGFDVTYLMDEVSSLISTPVYMVLLHRMRLCLDGRLTSFIIDEAWGVFNSPFWLKVLDSWVPTIRKLNGHFIFMTQSPETVLLSSIAPVILANVVTTIIFPNSDADPITYKKGLGLSESEFQIIRNANPASRQFLYRQRGEQSILCRLDLGFLNDEIRVFSGNKITVQLFNEIVKETGLNPDLWLPLFLQRSAG